LLTLLRVEWTGGITENKNIKEIEEPTRARLPNIPIKIKGLPPITSNSENVKKMILNLKSKKPLLPIAPPPVPIAPPPVPIAPPPVPIAPPPIPIAPLPHMKIFEYIINNNVKAVEEMISDGIDVNIRDKDNNTPLMIASSNGKIGIVKRLLKAGADTSLINNEGKTAKDLALKKGHNAIVEIFGKRNTTRKGGKRKNRQIIRKTRKNIRKTINK
jgi:hypothetical protein